MIKVIFVNLLLLIIAMAMPSLALDVPTSAESERITPLQKSLLPQRIGDEDVKMPRSLSGLSTPPKGAKEIVFVLRGVEVDGMTAFSKSEISAIYDKYLDKEISLDVIWLIANEITEKYHNEGYFLSRAFIPAQETESGIVIIRVVEGYIGEVILDDDDLSNEWLIKREIRKIAEAKPIKAQEIESFLLKLNDLPGVTFRAVLEALLDNEGGVRLNLLANDEAGVGMISYDNFGSRYLGPYQLNFNYHDSLISLQNTNISLLATTPSDELKYIALSHQIPILAGLNLELGGSYVKAAPGFSLENDEIRSDSVNASLGLNYQAIRQREENLLLNLVLDAKNTNSETLGAPLTRDRIRALRFGAYYDTSDEWSGYNYFNFVVSRGLGIFGASEDGDLNLSRAQAEEDFIKLEAYYTRMQTVTDDILAIASVSGQLSSGALFSSEEYGYGGQGFGRAYDASEIAGDEGVSASLEMRYLGVENIENIRLVPYAFYDIGRVYNDDIAQIGQISASSAGLGIYAAHESGVAVNLGVALPLTKTTDAPQLGSEKNPRILFSVKKTF
ncbi:MAG: hypothetical protein COV36_06290 [Alphaproteobacteria bacterium CG11_big_fil_rev_8_21_14_0_20_44_7]|nr:MAG: hypothetical protein COV36_06290 [Alphaproteobacteria bacterium CG11_big_fil_rev_8_21_14_0_20_44_7]